MSPLELVRPDLLSINHEVSEAVIDRLIAKGGGAASDSTYFLRQMIERGIDRAAIGMLWDPVAVDLAFAILVEHDLDRAVEIFYAREIADTLGRRQHPIRQTPEERGGLGADDGH